MIKLTRCAVLCCLALTGCVADSPFYRGFSSPDVEKTITDPSRTIMLALTQPVKTNDKSQVTTLSPVLSTTCASAYSASTAPAQCKLERNQAIYVLMTGSEQVCMAHRRSIYGREAFYNFGMGTLTSLFAGVATVATPTVSKSIFSALAFFTNSERALANDVVYKQIVVNAVDDKITQTRDLKARAITQNLKLELKDYPLSQAINDFMGYHNSCSFMEGLRLALAEGTKNTTQSKINDLNNRLIMNAAQMDLYCGSKKASSQQLCTTLTDRNKAISDELKTLEVR